MLIARAIDTAELYNYIIRKLSREMVELGDTTINDSTTFRKGDSVWI
jgi:hypothetical protein